MSVGIWQILIIAVVVVLLFGRGKISELMGDVAKGITSFKKGLREVEEEPVEVERPAGELPKTASPASATANVSEQAAEKDKATTTSA
ncbi:MAG: Sec-independent protein translocase protein TatA [Rhodothalassiaceae bacterium]|nr:MAG: Sec-independent protein translocase protein TatA [Rhodothalassiaceae bacterium]